MNKTKQQKVELVENMAKSLKEAASTVFVGFKGMNVADESAMRRSLRGDSVKYTVFKKTLLRRALESLGHAPSEVPLEGEVAVAYGGGDDVTAAARLIHDFGKKFKDRLVILGGIFEGKLAGEALMQEIATIPSMLGLRGMFAQVLNSPHQRFAVVLSAVAEKKSQS
ncbi:MAG: large subunit ribosomal protein L10 [Parcubacteria group bacterium Gr01-1014_8]|nr:MAG: large subunit ribosomal protein L10 [Parcubacteria group bacterium Gr01-1014_8]